MNQALSDAEIRAVARLAGIDLSDSEREELGPQLHRLLVAVRALECLRETEPILTFSPAHALP